MRYNTIYMVPSILLFTLFSIARCQADMIIRIDDVTMQAGSSASVNVWARSSNAMDTFGIFSFRIKIETISQTAGVLKFQPDFDLSDPNNVNTQNNLEQSDSSYIFQGRTEVSRFIAITQDNNLEFVGGDESSTGNITLQDSDWYLLGRVEMQHTTPTPLTSSGSYRVSLVSDQINTFFKDLDLNDFFDEAHPDIDPVSYTLANSGIVTITSVPEPSALAMLIGLATIYRNRRRVVNADHGHGRC